MITIKSKHEIEEAQESSRKKQEAELAQAEKVIKSKDDFIAAYVNHTDADNNYESGFYYFKAHADEFETLTEEELSSSYNQVFFIENSRFFNLSYLSE